MQTKIDNFQQSIDYFNLPEHHTKRFENLKNLASSLVNKINTFITKAEENKHEPEEINEMFSDSLSKMHDVSKTPIYIFLGCAILCFSCSTLFHLFLDHSPTFAFYFAKLDFAGISFLICGSSCAPIYYNSYCEQDTFVRNLYIGNSVFFCTAAFISMFIPKISQGTNKKYRAMIFVAAGLAPIVSLIHFKFFRNPLTMPEFAAFNWVLGGATYIFGAFIYAISK